jgi:hypothetical protein
MKQPTEPPLTKNERAALTDLITRASRTLPTDSDRKRLIRLHNLDRADRRQERHAAGNVSFQLGTARAALAGAQEAIARVRDVHRALQLADGWVCLGCGMAWPCPTDVVLAGS